MNSINTISIVACGWLGTPLAEALLAEGYKVKGSRRELSQLPELEALGVQAYQLELSDILESNDIQGLLDSELIIINIPPRRKVNSAAYHVRQIELLLEQVLKSKLTKVLFISSTSVYGNLNRELSESDALCPETESGRALVEIEERLFSIPSLQVTSLRFAGLVGGERKPGRFLSGKLVKGGQSPVNLLHRDDCIALIKALLKRNQWGEVFNACADEHPSRQELYTKAAKLMSLPEPQFETQTANWKIISNQKIKQALSYEFIHPDPLDFI